MVATGTVERDLGRLLGAVENLAQTARSDREEGRERDRKLDKLSEDLRSVSDRLREQTAAANDAAERNKIALSDVKKTAQNSTDALDGRIATVTINIQTLQAQIAQTTTGLERLASEQTKIRAEVAEVKEDTAKLQAPVNQLVGIRRAVIAWGAGVAAIAGYAMWLFRPLWDDLLHRLMSGS